MCVCVCSVFACVFACVCSVGVCACVRACERVLLYSDLISGNTLGHRLISVKPRPEDRRQTIRQHREPTERETT